MLSRRRPAGNQEGEPMAKRRKHKKKTHKKKTARRRKPARRKRSHKLTGRNLELAQALGIVRRRLGRAKF
jgi:hypothetical protein